VAQAARDLDVHENVLRKWLAAEVQSESAGAGVAKSEQVCCGRANIDHLCRSKVDQGLLLT